MYSKQCLRKDDMRKLFIPFIITIIILLQPLFGCTKPPEDLRPLSIATFNIAWLGDGEGKDSAKWSIENKNALTIDAPALTGIGDVQLFYIKHLSADALTLQMAEGADTSEMELKKLK